MTKCKDHRAAISTTYVFGTRIEVLDQWIPLPNYVAKTVRYTEEDGHAWVSTSMRRTASHPDGPTEWFSSH